MNTIMGGFLARGGTSQQTLQTVAESQLARDAAAAVKARAACVGRTAAKAAARELLTEGAAVRRARAAAIAQAAMDAAGNIPNAAAADDDEEGNSSSSSDGESAPPLKKKPATMRHLAQLTWFVRAVAIFMFLHPQLFHGDSRAVETAFGISRPTLSSWMSTTASSSKSAAYIGKWFDLVSNMTWAAARAQLKSFTVVFGDKFDHVPDDAKLSDSVLAKFKSARGKMH